MKLTFRSVSGRTAPPVEGYLVAFVPSFTLQRGEAKLSLSDAFMPIKTQTSYLQLAIVPFLLWDRGLPENRKTLVRKSSTNEEEC